MQSAEPTPVQWAPAQGVCALCLLRDAGESFHGRSMGRLQLQRLILGAVWISAMQWSRPSLSPTALLLALNYACGPVATDARRVVKMHFAQKANLM